MATAACRGSVGSGSGSAQANDMGPSNETSAALLTRRRLRPAGGGALRKGQVVTGTVTEVNGELATAPEKINKDAHSAWIMKIKLKNPSELNSLLSAADYEKFVEEEGGH